MIRIGIISAGTYGPGYRDPNAPRTPGSFHGTAFSTLYNGYNEALSKKWEWTFAASKRRLDGARVVKIWDPHKEWAERLAEVCDIEQVCDTPEACADDVDAVIIVDDGSGTQADYAAHPLRSGVPTFCDKPLGMTARQAAKTARIVRETGTPFMSASSLRFVPDIIKLRENVHELGAVHLVTTVCTGELVYYGMHALSMYYGVFGGGVVSCVNVGRPDRHVVRIRFRDDRDLVVMVAENEFMSYGFQISLYGDKGRQSLTPNLDDLYFFLQERFMEVVRTGKECVPVEEEVELIAALEAGAISLREGREVQIGELLG